MQVATNHPKVTPEIFEHYLAEILTPEQRKQFATTKELDSAIFYPGFVRCRLNCFDSLSGGALVLRLISLEIPTIDALRLPEVFKNIILRSQGLILVTGPTGSGKSTTLYAALADLARPEVNAITIEDPVEYRLPGIYQLQVNEKIDFDFAKALRSVLRSDPDVVMVGEIRDRETAEISMRAALTGHFVLSTLHTNDAPSAITRLTEMGVEPFVLASGITAVLAQRLARRLCEHCRQAYAPTAEELEKVGLAPGVDRLWRPGSCDNCTRGYRGRIGIFQFLTMTEGVSRLAARAATAQEIEGAGVADGMCSMWEDGIDKVVAGLTTVDELRRILI